MKKFIAINPFILLLLFIFIFNQSVFSFEKKVDVTMTHDVVMQDENLEFIFTIKKSQQIPGFGYVDPCWANDKIVIRLKSNPQKIFYERELDQCEKLIEPLKNTKIKTFNDGKYVFVKWHSGGASCCAYLSIISLDTYKDIGSALIKFGDLEFDDTGYVHYDCLIGCFYRKSILTPEAIISKEWTYINLPISNEENNHIPAYIDPRELEIEGREFGSKKYRLRYGYFRPMMIGGVTNHIYGESFLSFEEKETGKTFNITVDERFALYSLQGKCTEYFDDESLNKCKIDLPLKIKDPDDDLYNYAPIRIFDIDFDGDEEIIIGQVAGERFVHEYQIYEIRQGDKSIEAIPSISFRGNAEIDREKRILVNRHKSGGVCILTIDTYASNGKDFELVERIELDRDFDNNESDCVKKTYRRSPEGSLVLFRK